MSVERMKLVNLVGSIEKCDEIFRRLVLTEVVHPINALKEIDGHRFHSEEGLDYDVEMKTYAFGKYPSQVISYKSTQDRLVKLLGLLQIEANIDFDFLKKGHFNPYLAENIQLLFDKFEALNNQIETLTSEYELLLDSKIVESFSELNIDLNLLFNLDYYSTYFGTLSSEYRDKIAFNYENISAIVLHLSAYQGNETYVIIAPKDMQQETERILRSVHFKEIPLAMTYLDFPQVMLRKMNFRMIELSNELSMLRNDLESFRSKFEKPLLEAYSELNMERAIGDLRNQAAYTKSFFYFAGWVPESAVESLSKSLNSFQAEILLFFREKEEVDARFIPPTHLKNTWLTKPFETMVKMYGIPNYSEVDPTMLFGLTYMLLFGAMFGDAGQGLVFVFIGFLFTLNKGVSIYGQLMMRLGLSSALFGIWYDSVFGYEHVISRFIFGKGSDIAKGDSIFLRPIDNISTILALSIGLGIILLLISYGLSIVNKMRAKNFQESFFGRNGIAGMVLYICLLGIILDRFKVFENSIVQLLVGISALCVIVIVVREPLMNALTHHRPLYHEKASEYYIESGFDIVETFLSMLSNSVSFIRVGAFALNHVGLFIAFHTIADMLGSTTGSVITAIVGNIVVIGLEGLIVFIQGLRLIYYEMFSKYYSGDGFEYLPVSIGKQ